MNSHIYDKIEQAISRTSKVDPIAVLREGFSVFQDHWKSFFLFALVSGVIIRLAAVLYGTLIGMLSFSGLLIFLGSIGGLLLLFWVMASLHAGFFTYLRATREYGVTPTFSHFWEGFSGSRTYMAILLLQGLLVVAVGLVFGFVYILFFGGSYLDIIEDLFTTVSSSGSLDLPFMIFSLFLEYWIIIIPFVALTVLLILSFPLATGYYLSSSESIRYSIRLSIPRIGPMFLIWLPVGLLGYIANILGTRITLFFDLYTVFSTTIIQLLIGSTIAGLSPAVYYVLTENILGEHSQQVDDLINEIGENWPTESTPPPPDAD